MIGRGVEGLKKVFGAECEKLVILRSFWSGVQKVCDFGKLLEG